MNNRMLSVVIPAFNEGEAIEANIRRVQAVLSNANIEHELIVVDDGSTDTTWKEICKCSHTLSMVCGIKLSRNFGKEKALCAGFDAANGACCVCLDADMQFPPEIIPEMYREWNESGFDVVEGLKANRGKESLAYKLSAGLFYLTLKKMSGINLTDASDFRLLDRKAVKALQSLPEKQTFFRGMSTWIGFKRTQIKFDVEAREEGHSKWSISALVKLAIHAVTSYTAAPLYVSAFLGFGLLVAFVVLLFQTIVMKVLGYAADGFTTVIALQLVIGGSLMLSVGIIGIYIEKIYEEVKNRPRYIIEESIDSQTTKKDKAD